jgi:hypothetical protein
VFRGISAVLCLYFVFGGVLSGVFDNPRFAVPMYGLVGSSLLLTVFPSKFGATRAGRLFCFTCAGVFAVSTAWFLLGGNLSAQEWDVVIEKVACAAFYMEFARRLTEARTASATPEGLSS